MIKWKRPVLQIGMALVPAIFSKLSPPIMIYNMVKLAVTFSIIK